MVEQTEMLTLIGARILCLPDFAMLSASFISCPGAIRQSESRYFHRFVHSLLLKILSRRLRCAASRA